MSTNSPPWGRAGGGSLPRNLLLAFVLLGYLCTIAPATRNLVGAGGAALLGLGSLLLYPVALIGALWAYETRGPAAPPISFPLVGTWAASLIGLTVYGVLNGSPMRLVVFDLINLSVVLLGFILGRRDEVWREIRWPVGLLSLVSAVCCFALTDTAILTNRSLLNEQTGSIFEPTLAIVTLFAMVASADRKPLYYYVTLTASMGALLVYLYYARRGISVRCLSEILLAAILLPLLNGDRKRAWLGIATVPVIVVAILLVFPLDTLIGRFRGEFGLMDTLTTRNERLYEARLMFQEFSFFDTVFGRGMGGSFLQSTIAAEEFVTEEHGSYSGKYMTHGGAYYPVLKGGLLFALLYYLPTALLWLRPVRDPITRAAAWGALPWFAFQFIEGAPTHTTPWIGFGIGLILSRCQAVPMMAPFRRPVRAAPRGRMAVA